MPRNTREWAHRKIEEAKNNIDWAGYHLNEISETYIEQHPEISIQIEAFLQSFMTIDEALQALRDSF